jgi:predicted phage tail protein
MKTIRLYGDMGQRFGREFHLDVASPAEAIRALCAVIDGFEAYLHKHAKDYYKVFVGNRNACDAIPAPCSDREIIRIAPCISGAKSVGRVIIGAALIALSFINPIAGTMFATFLMSTGISLVLGGVMEMLSPQPRVEKGAGDDADNRASSNFNGPVNTTAQGNPVPLAYGTLMVGSAVISAGIISENM